jgi:hypothetical protein
MFCHPNLVVDKWELAPAIFTALRAEHWVCADDPKPQWKNLEEEVAGELLDGEHVGDDGVGAELVEGDGADDGLGGQDGAADLNVGVISWDFFAARPIQ